MKAKNTKADPCELKRIADRILTSYEKRCKQRREKEDAAREKAFKERQRKSDAEARKQPKPDLSQIKFPHWWKDRAFIQRLTENQVPIEEQKAAVWYEAVRRRSEVQQAWLQGKSLFGDNGWQHFTGWVVQYLPLSWPELDPIVRDGIIESSYSHWSVPPEGYSTFPPDTDKARQRHVSMQVLRLPDTDDPQAAARFVKWARKFEDSGFTIVAIDKKSVKSEQRGLEAIKALPRTFRKADLKMVVFHRVPPDATEAEKRVLEEKQRQGAVTPQDFDELWNRHIKPTQNLYAPWAKTATVEERVFHKRKRKGELIEGKQFDFEGICRQLEAFDNGAVSEFVQAVRL